MRPSGPETEAAKVGRAMRNVGFTLFELVLILAIIVVFATMAAPRYSNACSRYQADSVARRIVSDFELARSSAGAASSSQRVEFRVDLNLYRLLDQAPLDPGPATYEVKLGDYQASLVSADFGGDSTVTFSGWGIPDSGGTVVISVHCEQRTISLDAEAGRASIQ